jgi:hypothetical protein
VCVLSVHLHDRCLDNQSARLIEDENIFELRTNLMLDGREIIGSSIKDLLDSNPRREPGAGPSRTVSVLLQEDTVRLCVHEPSPNRCHIWSSPSAKHRTPKPPFKVVRSRSEFGHSGCGPSRLRYRFDTLLAVTEVVDLENLVGTNEMMDEDEMLAALPLAHCLCAVSSDMVHPIAAASIPSEDPTWVEPPMPEVMADVAQHGLMSGHGGVLVGQRYDTL